VPSTNWRYILFVPTVTRLSHSDIAMLAKSFFASYRQPDLTLTHGASASKIELDDISEKREFLLSQKHVDTVYDTLDSYKTAGDAIYNTHFIEVPIKVFKYSIGELETIADNANDLHYTFDSPSEEYTLYLLNYLNSSNSHAHRQFHNGYWLLSEIPEGCRNILQFIAETCDLVTLKIQSVKHRGYTKFVEFALSACYEIAFNLRAQCFPTFSLSEYFSEPALKSKSRDVLSTSFPKRRYKTQLLEHYSYALVSQNPASTFLSFYNIVEFFYNSSVVDEGIDQLRNMITRTGFSIRSDEHVKELLLMITKKYSIEGENTLKGNKEIDSLKLTLTKYAPLVNLQQTLSQEEIEYYSTNKVAFSGGLEIDFSRPDLFVESLAQRIYSTRNSVVHSKEDNQKKYSPSRDRNILLREMGLMRCLAEVVIESSSEELNF
jgi:hypothetical protein